MLAVLFGVTGVIACAFVFFFVLEWRAMHRTADRSYRRREAYETREETQASELPAAPTVAAVPRREAAQTA